MNDQQSLGGINVNITASYDQFTEGVTKVERKLDDLTSKVNAKSSKISAGAIALGNVVATAVTKAVSVVVSNIDYAVRRLDSLNRFPIVMENLGINANEAKNAINALANYTLNLPTTLNDAAEKVQYFTSATGNVWQSIKIFQALNDAIVSGAQTAEVQSTALYQWSQAIVRGSFDIERECNAMVVANAKAVNEISEQLLGTGKDFNDLWEALKNGETTVYDMVNAMVYLDKNARRTPLQVSTPLSRGSKPTSVRPWQWLPKKLAGKTSTPSSTMLVMLSTRLVNMWPPLSVF